jgi:hypothetical protein
MKRVHRPKGPRFGGGFGVRTAPAITKEWQTALVVGLVLVSFPGLLVRFPGLIDVFRL